MWPRTGPVVTYGLLYLIGIVLHFVLSWRIAKRHKLRRRVWLTVRVCYLLAMLVGAKLLYDARHHQLDLWALWQAERWLSSGLWGGLLAYFALAVPAVILLTPRRPAGLDLVALTVPMPWMAAKLGCFLNGCCHGRPCSLPWAVTFPPAARTAPPGVPLHPTQLYEVGLMLLVLLVFSRLKSARWEGTKLLWFLLLYGTGRAATDFLRGDTEGPLYLGLLSLTQLLSLAAAAGALLLLVAHAHKGDRCAELPHEP
ncbi:MAG: prolipoprotein diacylglyceryl transferase [Planctomycetes bacterium]|nr:prolipoprotein diacylglyceryl transferase [Planctomycetota bacterium]